MTATITSAGHPDTNVTWSINAVTNGNSTLGTITTTNGGAATYTAPAALPTPNTVTVQATSEADPSQSASVTARIDIPVQQYYSLTGSNGLATFALSTPSSSAQARRAVIHPNSPGPIAQSSSSGPTLQIEAIDQNTQAPVEGIGISLSTDVAGDAAIVLSDSAGRYYTSSQILELPSSSTGTPAPIQVTIPPVVTPSSGSSTGTVNSIPVPSVNSSNVLTPNQESVSEQNWEGFAATFGYTLTEEHPTVAQLEAADDSFWQQLVQEFSTAGLIHLTLESIDAGPAAPEMIALVGAAEATTALPNLINSYWNSYLSRLPCEGYTTQQITLFVLSSPLQAGLGFNNITIWASAQGQPGPSQCTPGTGAIQGSVYDASNSSILLAGASITDAGPTPESTQSGQNGAFSLVNLQPGAYLIFVRQAGYENSLPIPLQVNGGQVANAGNIGLQPLPGYFTIQIQALDSTILQPNDQTQITGEALDASGALTNPQPTLCWYSINEAVATVSSSCGASTIVQAVAVGTTEVYAKAGGVYSNAVTVTVESQAPEISSIQRITYDSPLIDSLPSNQFPRGGTYTAIIQGSGLASMDTFSPVDPRVTGTVISATDTQVNVLISSTPVTQADTADAPIPSVSFDLSYSLGSLNSGSVTLDIVAGTPPQATNFQVTNGVSSIPLGAPTVVVFSENILDSGNVQFFYVGCGSCSIQWNPITGTQFSAVQTFTATVTIPQGSTATSFSIEAGAVDGAGQSGSASLTLPVQ